MRLDREFIRLPFLFDQRRLSKEVLGLAPDLWRDHPQGYAGNTALALVSVGGDPADDATRGAMEPTPVLSELGYIRQVLASFDAPIGRSRLMRIAAGAEVPSHTDTNIYWHDRLRIHVPVLTGPGVEFMCGSSAVHMAAGESWVFDTSRPHTVVNPLDADRVHLVIDTVGSASLWEHIEHDSDDRPADIEVPYAAGIEPAVDYEKCNLAAVMSPAEQSRLIESILANEQTPSALTPILQRLSRAWTALWARWGEDPAGHGEYRAELDEVRGALDNALPGHHATIAQVEQLILRPALFSSEPATPSVSAPAPTREPATGHTERAVFERPVVIVSPPRAGSTLLFETLARSPELVSIGAESHGVIERIGTLHPSARDFDSNELDASDASPAVADELIAGFRSLVRDRVGKQPRHEATGLRLLEKTPKNALRVPFVDAVFPDARFVYLYRDPREELSSMLEAWRSGRFVTYPELPGWDGRPWSLLLIPGWRDLIGRPLAEVVAAQWATTTTILLDHLEALDPDRWCVASYQGLVDDPASEIRRICAFVDVEWDDPLDGPLPSSRHTLTPPAPGKWEANWSELEPVLDEVADVAARAAELFGREVTKPAPARRSKRAVAETPVEPFKSVHTASVASLLDQAASSVLVSTYQSGRLITLRVADGKVNTHFQRFARPMGIAYKPGNVALGTKADVWHFRDQPAVATKLGDPHDACFMPRSRHTTGDISIHEMAFGNDELWVVNTRFSCLATLDAEHSFVPRWRPDFVSAYAAEDRCHLNGLAMRDGEPAYVTALGVSDTATGWRENKAHGGCIIDVASGERIVTGLSMPHSPRWHDGSLWVLESGCGGLVKVDTQTGGTTTVATVPGFARGLAFIGRYALIGLSQVREKVFGGLPLTQTDEPRHCGVWVVDTESGETVGFVRFEGVVEEIFDVQVLAGVRHPELVDNDHELAESSYVVPTDVLAEVG